MGTDPRIQLVQSHRTITSSTFTMKFAIVVLALVAFVNAGDIATEGMQDIVDIQDYVVKIGKQLMIWTKWNLRCQDWPMKRQQLKQPRIFLQHKWTRPVRQMLSTTPTNKV